MARRVTNEAVMSLLDIKERASWISDIMLIILEEVEPDHPLLEDGSELHVLRDRIAQFDIDIIAKGVDPESAPGVGCLND